jgi:hypothetical protein
MVDIGIVEIFGLGAPLGIIGTMFIATEWFYLFCLKCLKLKH